MADDYTYLKSHITIGIPNDTYKNILKEVKQQSKDDVAPTFDTINGGYTWITADLQPDARVTCNLDARRTSVLGSLPDIVTKLKSNVRGYGHFDISIQYYDQVYFLKFTLKEFQLVDETKVSSAHRPCLNDALSEKLKTKLGTS